MHTPREIFTKAAGIVDFKQVSGGCYSYVTIKYIRIYIKILISRKLIRQKHYGNAIKHGWKLSSDLDLWICFAHSVTNNF